MKSKLSGNPVTGQGSMANSGDIRREPSTFGGSPDFGAAVHRVRRSQAVKSAIAAALAIVVATFGLVAISAVAITSGPSSATDLTYAVQVGYADTYRPLPSSPSLAAEFPTVWPNASPDVTVPYLAGGTEVPNTWIDTPDQILYVGCPPFSAANGGCAGGDDGAGDNPNGYDASAIRIINTSPSALPLQQITLNFNACSYDLWPNLPDLNIQPNWSVILTETASGPGHGCTPQTGQMDGSDIGASGQDIGDGAACAANDNMQATIDVNVGGTTLPYVDSGQVLNTGGIDYGDCGNPEIQSNESTNWVPIGSTRSCGSAASLTLVPSSQQVQVGNVASVEGTVSNACGTAYSNVPVTFTVSGPNGQSAQTFTTDANGTAQFTYTGYVPGADVVSASVQSDLGVFSSTNSAVVTWLPPNQPVANLVIIGTPVPSTTGAVTYTATVEGTGPTPTGWVDICDTVTGCPPALTIDGQPNSCYQAPLNISGVATCTLQEAASSSPITVSGNYGGDGNYAATDATLTVTSGASTAGSNGVTADAQGGGSGDTVTEAQYGYDPYNADPNGPLSDGSNYFDVSVSPYSSYGDVVIMDCSTGAALNPQIVWWNTTLGEWVPVNAPETTVTGPPICVDVTITNATTPSLSQLGGTVFATGGMPGFTSSASDSVTPSSPFTFKVTTAGRPIPKIKKAGKLPKGIKLTDDHNGTATLSGSSPSAPGTYSMTFEAKFPKFGKGTRTATETQVFTLHVS